MYSLILVYVTNKNQYILRNFFICFIIEEEFKFNYDIVELMAGNFLFLLKNVTLKVYIKNKCAQIICMEVNI